MVNYLGGLDSLILEVFEENDDQFFFPLTSQKTARAFAKAIHSKGYPYEEMCQEISEIEHNFSAWRKGLGRIGIGKRILERFNQPLQDLLDDEEEVDYARLIQAVNGRNGSKSTDAGGQASDHSTRVPPTNTPASRASNNGTVGNEAASVSLRHVERQDSKKEEESTVTVNFRQNLRHVERELSPVNQEKRESSPAAAERGRESSTGSGTNAPTGGVANRIKNFEQRRSSSEENRSSGEESRSSGKRSRSGSESRSSGHGSRSGSESRSSEEREEKKENKVEVVKEKIERESSVDAGETREERLAKIQNRIAQLKKKFPKPEDVTDTETKPKRGSSSSEKSPDLEVKVTETKSANQVTENYDSDLDLDIGDIDEERSRIVAEVATLRSKVKDGSGFLYVWTSGNRHKVGGSRNPDGRLSQCQLFNPDVQEVTRVRVSQRREALNKVISELSCYENDNGWYQAEVNTIVDVVSHVADKFSTDSSLC